MKTNNKNKKGLPAVAQAKSGYKKTKLGWIPVDWKVKKLKEILIEGRLGGNYENAESNTGIPVIKMGNLNRGVIKIDKIQYLLKNIDYNNEDVLKRGDLLFNTRNTLDLVGKVAIWNNELPLAVYNSNLMRMKFDKDFVQSNWFMNYAFNAHCGLSQLRSVATGTTSVAAIYGRDLNTTKFLLPPLPEQKAIANLLSTWDEAITKTKALIEQKELRKKWLMQKLLTGKTRLPGFSDEWKEDIIGNVFNFVKSNSHSRENLTYNSSEGKFINIHYGDIHTVFKKDILNIELESRLPLLKSIHENGNKFEFLKDGDIIIADASEDYTGVGESFEITNINSRKVISGLHTIVLRKKRDLFALNFCGYLFNGEKILNLLRKVATGVSVYGISKTNVASVKIQFPSIKEQTAIARVLQTADKEIETLKAKLEKLKEQKKGLMQILLTGKKRLNCDL